jgi:ribonucleoside-triphosphate reductase
VRPANSVNTAFQLVAVIFQLQSLQQFGGVSATHLDWTMVPYVRKSFYKHYRDGLKWVDMRGDVDEIMATLNKEMSIEDPAYKKFEKSYRYAMEMTQRETHQAVEGMYHNLNTLQSRSGNQLPFTSINYGTCTLPEGRMVTRELLNVSLQGVGKLGLTPIFPCGIFQYMKGVNDAPGTPNYDLFRLALESTSRRLYPNYANVDWSGNAGYDRNDPRTYFSTMGCRTANGMDINGLGQMKDGRANICPVTIILPTLAMEAKEREGDIIDNFMQILDDAIFDAKDRLLERFEWICSQDAASAKFMWMNGTMEGYIPEEGIRSALKHGTIVIGQLGLAEALQVLIGKDHTTAEGMELAKRIEQLFKTRCAQFKEEEKLNFGVYYTPAENLCYTAMKAFKKQYGEIPNVSDREYFTNSMHVPVWKEVSPFEKIDIESQLTGYSSAGCITYVELDGAVHDNLDALEAIGKYAMDKDIPYFAINIPNDQCLDCGWTGDINDACPKCGGTHIQRLRRVTGYLTGNYTTAFNLGKQAEVKDRYKHSNRLVNWRH